jgi:hypothetical protein
LDFVTDPHFFNGYPLGLPSPFIDPIAGFCHSIPEISTVYISEPTICHWAHDGMAAL